MSLHVTGARFGAGSLSTPADTTIRTESALDPIAVFDGTDILLEGGTLECADFQTRPGTEIILRDFELVLSNPASALSGTTTTGPGLRGNVTFINVKIRAADNTGNALFGGTTGRGDATYTIDRLEMSAPRRPAGPLTAQLQNALAGSSFANVTAQVLQHGGGVVYDTFNLSSIRARGDTDRDYVTQRMARNTGAGTNAYMFLQLDTTLDAATAFSNSEVLDSAFQAVVKRTIGPLQVRWRTGTEGVFQANYINQATELTPMPIRAVAAQINTASTQQGSGIRSWQYWNPVFRDETGRLVPDVTLNPGVDIATIAPSIANLSTTGFLSANSNAFGFNQATSNGILVHRKTMSTQSSEAGNQLGVNGSFLNTLAGFLESTPTTTSWQYRSYTSSSQPYTAVDTLLGTDGTGNGPRSNGLGFVANTTNPSGANLGNYVASDRRDLFAQHDVAVSRDPVNNVIANASTGALAAFTAAEVTLKFTARSINDIWSAVTNLYESTGTLRDFTLTNGTWAIPRRLVISSTATVHALTAETITIAVFPESVIGSTSEIQIVDIQSGSSQSVRLELLAGTYNNLMFTGNGNINLSSPGELGVGNTMDNIVIGDGDVGNSNLFTHTCTLDGDVGNLNTFELTSILRGNLGDSNIFESLNTLDPTLKAIVTGAGNRYDSALTINLAAFNVTLGTGTRIAGNLHPGNNTGTVRTLTILDDVQVAGNLTASFFNVVANDSFIVIGTAEFSRTFAAGDSFECRDALTVTNATLGDNATVVSIDASGNVTIGEVLTSTGLLDVDGFLNIGANNTGITGGILVDGLFTTGNSCLIGSASGSDTYTFNANFAPGDSVTLQRPATVVGLVVGSPDGLVTQLLTITSTGASLFGDNCNIAILTTSGSATFLTVTRIGNGTVAVNLSIGANSPGIGITMVGGILTTAASVVFNRNLIVVGIVNIGLTNTFSAFICSATTLSTVADQCVFESMTFDGPVTFTAPTRTNVTSDATLSGASNVGTGFEVGTALTPGSLVSSASLIAGDGAIIRGVVTFTGPTKTFGDNAQFVVAALIFNSASILIVGTGAIFSTSGAGTIVTTQPLTIGAGGAINLTGSGGGTFTGLVTLGNTTDLSATGTARFIFNDGFAAMTGITMTSVQTINVLTSNVTVVAGLRVNGDTDLTIGGRLNISGLDCRFTGHLSASRIDANAGSHVFAQLTVSGNCDVGPGTTFNGPTTLLQGSGSDIQGNFVIAGMFSHNRGTLGAGGRLIDGAVITELHIINAELGANLNVGTGSSINIIPDAGVTHYNITPTAVDGVGVTAATNFGTLIGSGLILTTSLASGALTITLNAAQAARIAGSIDASIVNVNQLVGGINYFISGAVVDYDVEPGVTEAVLQANLGYWAIVSRGTDGTSAPTFVTFPNSLSATGGVFEITSTTTIAQLRVVRTQAEANVWDAYYLPANPIANITSTLGIFGISIVRVSASRDTLVPINSLPAALTSTAIALPSGDSVSTTITGTGTSTLVNIAIDATVLSDPQFQGANIIAASSLEYFMMHINRGLTTGSFLPEANSGQFTAGVLYVSGRDLVAIAVDDGGSTDLMVRPQVQAGQYNGVLPTQSPNGYDEVLSIPDTQLSSTNTEIILEGLLGDSIGDAVTAVFSGPDAPAVSVDLAPIELLIGMPTATGDTLFSTQGGGGGTGATLVQVQTELGLQNTALATARGTENTAQNLALATARGTENTAQNLALATARGTENTAQNAAIATTRIAENTTQTIALNANTDTRANELKANQTVMKDGIADASLLIPAEDGNLPNPEEFSSNLETGGLSTNAFALSAMVFPTDGGLYVGTPGGGSTLLNAGDAWASLGIAVGTGIDTVLSSANIGLRMTLYSDDTNYGIYTLTTYSDTSGSDIISLSATNITSVGVIGTTIRILSFELVLT